MTSTPNFRREQILRTWTDAYFGGKQDLRRLLERTAIHVCDKVFSRESDSPHIFTDHGPTHSDRVLFYAHHLAQHMERCGQRRLSPEEALFLAAACYMHDLGMVGLPPGLSLENGFTLDVIDKIRETHPLAITSIMRDHADDLHDLAASDTLAWAHFHRLCMGHASTYHQKMARELSDHTPVSMRLCHLSKILLLADELDLTSVRSDVTDKKFPALGPYAKAHWLRHHYVVHVELTLPIITLHFQFPCDINKYRPFAEWTIRKLNHQVSLVTEGLPALERKHLELRFEPDFDESSTNRIICPAETLQCVHDETVRLIRKSGAHSSAQGVRRPRQSLSGDRACTPSSAVRPALTQLVNEAFFSFRTISDPSFLKHTYVKVADNLGGMKALAALVQDCIAKRSASPPRVGEREPSRKVWMLVGATGVGKSSFIRYFFDEFLPSNLPSGATRPLSLVLDCPAKDTREKVIRSLLVQIILECELRLEAEDVAELRAQRYLPRDTAAAMEYNESQCETALHLLLLAVQGLRGGATQGGESVPIVRSPRFVILALDNIDRASTEGLIGSAFDVANMLAKETACMVLFPVRPSTSWLLRQARNDLSDRPSVGIVAPAIGDVLRARIAFAFAAANPSHTEYSRAVRERLVNVDGVPLELTDVRKAIERICHLFVQKWEEHRVLPDFVGGDIRLALEVLRDVILSRHMRTEDFLLLMQGEVGHPYRLIRNLMLGDQTFYDSSKSSFVNLFEPLAPHGPYFAAINMLDLILDQVSSVEPGDDYVDLWRLALDAQDRYGYDRLMLNKVIWRMLKKRKFPLLEMIDETALLPGDLPNDESALSDTVRVRITCCGRFFRERLIMQLQYIQTIMFDTLLPTPFARAIAEGDVESWAATKERVLKFLGFLRDEEIIERSKIPYPIRYSASELLMSEVSAAVNDQIRRIDG